MAVLQAILLLVLRSIGRLLQTVFGWATLLLFGRVPRQRHLTLNVMLVVSVIWLICVVGVILPSVALFLLAFAQLPDDIDHDWVRALLLAAAVVLPLAVGLLMLRLPHHRAPAAPDRRLHQIVLSGYPTTLGLGLTLVMLIVLVPAIKLRAALRGQTTQHVPMIIDAIDYAAVVTELQGTLDREGWPTEQRPMSWTLRVPTLVLAVLAGRTLERRIAEQLITLSSPSLQVILHPSGALIRGTSTDLVRVRAAIVEHLAFSNAYMTWDPAGHALEDDLAAIWRAIRSQSLSITEAMTLLAAIEHDIRAADLPYDEWEILYRETLLVQRAVLRVATADPTASQAVGQTDSPPRTFDRCHPSQDVEP